MPKPAGVEIVFGYRKVKGLPKCPCKDPGDYMSCEMRDPRRPLEVHFRCWCGNVLECKFDNEKEKKFFMNRNGVKV